MIWVDWWVLLVTGLIGWATVVLVLWLWYLEVQYHNENVKFLLSRSSTCNRPHLDEYHGIISGLNDVAPGVFVRTTESMPYSSVASHIVDTDSMMNAPPRKTA